MLTIANKQEFESRVLKADMPVLVDFFAPWCGPCKMLAPELDALAEEYQGKALVAKVDVDALPELASQFNVMSVPTLVIMKGGQEVKRFVGFRPRKDIGAALDGAM
ncbi:MAG: thioredoxin [Negativicutes bacterium]|nr:thioredoxin [Negativicutes bacterium]